MSGALRKQDTSRSSAPVQTGRPRPGPRVAIVTPAPRGSLTGNRVSALRYARLLRTLGCRVRVLESWDAAPTDLLIVLNARRGARSVLRARAERAELPIVVVVTGTDVYGVDALGAEMKRALAVSDCIVGLQDDSLRRLPVRFGAKARTILQSYDGPRLPRRSTQASFDFLVLAHLRPQKDPLRAALAARLLPPESRIRVLHAGQALSPALERRACREMAINPRYRWLGALSRRAALGRLAGARALILSSRIEGGPGVFSEALALGVPILASRIGASLSILSARHPGLFTLGNTRELARLMRRAELEPRFLEHLAAASRKLAPRFEPALELAAWRGLLVELLGRGRLRPANRAGKPARRGRAAR